MKHLVLTSSKAKALIAWCGKRVKSDQPLAWSKDEFRAVPQAERCPNCCRAIVESN